MTFYPERYPENWGELRASILARANNRCERCGVENHVWIIRSSVNGARYIQLDTNGDYWLDGEPLRMSEEPSEFADSKLTWVVLTIAHLDHDTTHNDPANLMALCQRCHLLHDAQDNHRKARATRQKQRDEQSGQLRIDGL